MNKMKHKKTISEEIEEDTIKLFEKIDKIIEKDYGKMCPTFEPDCFQCRFHLAYNEFKHRIWEEFVRTK